MSLVLSLTCNGKCNVPSAPPSQNVLEKSGERETRQEYALAMIQCKVLKQLENLDQQKYDDEDITDDIKFLLERLGESVQDLRWLPHSSMAQTPPDPWGDLEPLVYNSLEIATYNQSEQRNVT